LARIGQRPLPVRVDPIPLPQGAESVRARVPISVPRTRCYTCKAGWPKTSRRTAKSIWPWNASRAGVFTLVNPATGKVMGRDDR